MAVCNKDARVRYQHFEDPAKSQFEKACWLEIFDLGPWLEELEKEGKIKITVLKHGGYIIAEKMIHKA